jgi:hypothetical protein
MTALLAPVLQSMVELVRKLTGRPIIIHPATV